MSNLSSLSELMRPKSLQDLALSLDHIRSLQGFARSGYIPNLLLSGHPGTGKSSTVSILKDAINAEVRSYTDTSKDLKPASFHARTFESVLEGRPLVHLVEDAEFMSPRLQASLRTLIEELLPHCRFIFTVNDTSKFDRPLMSRLTHISYYLPPTERPRIMQGLCHRYEKHFAEKGLAYSRERLTDIIALRFPDFRATANQIELEVLRGDGQDTAMVGSTLGC